MTDIRCLDFFLTAITAFELPINSIAFDLTAYQHAIEVVLEYKKKEIFKITDFSGLIGNLEALKLKFMNDDQLDALGQSFANRVLQLWFDAIHLEPEVANLSVEEAIALSDYLYINELMLRCKEAAVRLTPQVWEGIEERMLKIKDEG